QPGGARQSRTPPRSCESASPACVALRPAPTRFARQSVLGQPGGARQSRTPPRSCESASPACVALRPAPTRFARQSVLGRPGGARQSRTPPMKAVRALVAYDGTDYHGFAENAGVATVGGALRTAIEQVVGAPIELTAAGRTDAGVHAWGQAVWLDVPDGPDLVRLPRPVNR